MCPFNIEDPREPSSNRAVVEVFVMKAFGIFGVVLCGNTKYGNTLENYLFCLNLMSFPGLRCQGKELAVFF